MRIALICRHTAPVSGRKLHNGTGVLAATACGVACAGINACVTVGRLEEAQRTMDAMRAQSSPDLRAFNILIKGYSRAGDVAALQRTLQSIRSQVLTLHPES